MQKLFLVILLSLSGTILLAGEPGEHIKAALAAEDRSEADKQLDDKRKPDRVLAFFDIKQGMNVVDLFAGGGYYTEIIAHAVGPEGKVTMHNNGPWMSYVEKEVKTRLKDNRLPNVTRLDMEIEDMKLPENGADAIFMVLTFHDLYFTQEGWPLPDAPRFLKAIYEGLAPGGTFAIVDHQAATGTGSESAQKLHRIEGAFAKKVITSAGFRFVSESDLLQNKDDNHTISVFDPAMRRKTDRFIYKFVKPK